HSAPPTRRAPPGAGFRPPAAGQPVRRPAAPPSGAGSARAAAGSAMPSRAVRYVLHSYDHYVLYGPPSESEESRPARVSALLRIPKTGAEHSEERLPNLLRIPWPHPPVDNLGSSSHAAPCAVPLPAG